MLCDVKGCHTQNVVSVNLCQFLKKKNQTLNLSNGTITFFLFGSILYITSSLILIRMIKKEALKKLMRVNLFCSNLKTALLV